MSRSGLWAGSAVDAVLDRTVVVGYTRFGLAARRRLPGWPADPAPDALGGHDVVVTGASSGLGVATAEGVARLGARVHLVVRDLGKGGRVRDEVARAVPGADLTLWRCDVADLDDVRRFAAELSAQVPSVRAVVHNAGVMPPERTESRQGHELALATHVLGPVLMSERLLNALAADGGRVVFVTSGGMYTQRLPTSDLEYAEDEYRPASAYARSKRVQVSLLPLLDARWRSRGVTAHATHPGWADTPGVQDSLPGFHRLTRRVLRDAEEGADTTVWLTAVEPGPDGGRLWHDRRPRPTHLTPFRRESGDERAAVWQAVLEATGLQ